MIALILTITGLLGFALFLNALHTLIKSESYDHPLRHRITDVFLYGLCPYKTRKILNLLDYEY